LARTSNTATTIESLAVEDDLFTVDLARALALFAEPKRGGRRQMTKRVIRQIEVPGGGAALQVLEGRYGPYVTDGETNASIPKGLDPAAISLDEARGLLEARRGAPPREKRGGRFGAKRRSPRAAAPVEVVAPVVKTKARGAVPPRLKAKAQGKRKSASRKTLH